MLALEALEEDSLRVGVKGKEASHISSRSKPQKRVFFLKAVK